MLMSVAAPPLFDLLGVIADTVCVSVCVCKCVCVFVCVCVRERERERERERARARACALARSLEFARERERCTDDGSAWKGVLTPSLSMCDQRLGFRV
jgi:hypothetical protein